MTTVYDSDGVEMMGDTRPPAVEMEGARVEVEAEAEAEASSDSAKSWSESASSASTAPSDSELWGKW